MSNPLKSLAKGIKRIGRAIKSAFSSIGRAVKKVFSSPIGKAILLGVGLYFGVPFAANALGLSSTAAAGSTGGAWWGSTFGIGQGAAAATAATEIAPIAGANVASSASVPAITGKVGGSLAGTGPTAMGSTPSFYQAASTLGSSATQGAAQTGLLGGVTKTVGGIWGGLGDVGKAAVINTAGNMIQGAASAKAAQQERDDQWRREDEQKAEKSVFGMRWDGQRPIPDYQVGSMLARAGTGMNNPYANRFMVPQRAPEQEFGLLSGSPYIYQA